MIDSYKRICLYTVVISFLCEINLVILSSLIFYPVHMHSVVVAIGLHRAGRITAN